MPQELRNLEIEEVSLVSAPACAETIQGRKVPRATIAIWKRDDSGDYLTPSQVQRHMAALEKSRKRKDDPGSQDVDVPGAVFVDNPPVTGQTPERKKLKEKKRMSKFQKVLKSATTRSEIVAGVQRKAEQISKRDGISPDVAQARIWEAYPEAREAWEGAPAEITKADPRMMSITKSEVELDKRARKLQKRSPGMTYGSACAKALEEDPSIYSAYEKEKAEGLSYLVPDSGPGQDHPLYKSGGGDDDDDEDEDRFGLCAKCNKKLRKGDKFCGSCGADCMKAKSRKRTAA